MKLQVQNVSVAKRTEAASPFWTDRDRPGYLLMFQRDFMELISPENLLKNLVAKMVPKWGNCNDYSLIYDMKMATNLKFLVAIGNITSPMATKMTKFPGLAPKPAGRASELCRRP